ncbi:MAG: hypothetical protein WCH43_07015 [Verrucomicrobiota bacterium]
MKTATRTLLTALACVSLAWSAQAQDSGIKISIMIHDDGSKTVTKLDPDAHTSEASTFNTNEKLEKRIVFNLDENNRTTSGVLYNAAGKPLKKFTYKYDTDRKLQEEQDFTPDDKFTGKFVYEYNLKGVLMKIRAFDANGKELAPLPGRPIPKIGVTPKTGSKN